MRADRWRALSVRSVGVAGVIGMLLVAGCDKASGDADAAAPPPQASRETQTSSLDAASAKAFVASIYAHYRASAASPWDPLADRSLFEASTAQLIAQGNKPGPNDEIGPLEFDPVCACQDTGGMEATITGAKVDGSFATVTVALKFPDSGKKRTKVTFDLASADGQWRIFDLHEPDLPSLRKLMDASIHHAAT